MNFHSISPSETENKLGTDFNSGLSSSEAAKRLKAMGENRIEEKKKKSLLKRFSAQFSDFMIITLIASAAISFFVSKANGEQNITDPLIILAIVIFNATIGVIQESRAENAIEALKKLTDPKALCLRDGKKEKIPSELLVPGDIIFFSSGDLVPADAKIIEATSFSVNEASLTGEADRVAKAPDAVLPPDAPLHEMSNIVFASSLVSEGHAKAVVFATGMNTRVGRIADMIKSTSDSETPLSKRLKAVGRLLAIGAIFCCFVIFAAGLFMHYDPFFMFMTSVSLAVAAIPEGLPAIVTVILAMGVSSLADKKAVVRSLPAVETLGSATVICTDKTGTLTVNEMTVRDISGDEKNVLTLMALASNSDGANGSGTENAIVRRFGENVFDLRKKYPRISEIPFSSERKTMTTVNRTEKGPVTIIKGAFDAVLLRCDKILVNGKALPLSSEHKKKLLSECEASAKKGLRVLSVAAVLSGNSPAESAFCYVGSVSLYDPLRPESKKAVLSCRNAGIKVIMITGDHEETAKSIAAELGLGKGGVLTGRELLSMDDSELKKSVRKVNVFARVLPEQKLKIVKALQSNGHIVAMTGDGVNDAPALKSADIGCAMGKSGTDVARAAADMILTDDNFSTVADAVREGRIIYQNIKKAIHFLISSNIGEILLMLLGMFLGYGAVLFPIQLLWVNLITDSLPAIALGMDKADDGVMKKKPQNPKKGFFSDGLAADIITEGCLIGAVSLAAYCFGRFSPGGGEAIGRTTAFCTLSISQLIHAFDVRSEESIFKVKTRNPHLIPAFFTGLFMQCSVCLIKPLISIFHTVPLSLEQWLAVFIFSFIPFIASELGKLTNKQK